jgi:predicted amidophosphoribosyltransferase
MPLDRRIIKNNVHDFFFLFMSRYNRQLVKQRADFELALKRSRCPKCGGHVLETSQPDTVCQKCGSQFVLAIQSGSFLMRTKLIEKQQTPSSVAQLNLLQAASGHFCHNCGAAAKEGSKFCNKCGTQLR